MATTAPGAEIRVFAMFPPSRSNFESSCWNWVNCLTFSIDTLNELQFSPKPYKWIRYATGVVVGAQGDLSFTSNPPHNILEYNSSLPLESIDLYYHINDAEKERMFPVDPDMNRTSITDSDVTSRREDFCGEVVERDGSCVLTGFIVDICDAAHLLPHCKGNEYIKNYTRGRSRDAAGNDIVHETDDVRNGILLNKFTHCSLATDVAFLVTPNFAMSTADIDPTAPPTEKRCTAHLFDSEHPERLGNPTFRSGALVRMPDATDDWPPDILFDVAYAKVVLHHFAPQSMQDTLRECWKHTFFARGTTNAARASHQANVDEQAAESERKNKRNQDRDRRIARRRAADQPDYFDFLMMMPFVFMPPEEREAMFREAAEKRAEKERSQLEDKVADWAKDVAGACP